MLDELLPHYQKELTYLRKLSQEFADQYPQIASRLLIQDGVCADPHVERLIESFAFLSARIHRKLDDEFPEITDAFLGVLYPHFLRPIPSMSIVQFLIDPQNAQLTSRYTVDRHTPLFSRSVAGTYGMQCRFRTSYPVDVWPIQVVDARFESVERSPFAQRSAGAVGVIRIKLATVGDLTFQTLGIDKLRFFIDEPGAYSHTLYELLFNNAQSITLVSGHGPRDAKIDLAQGAIGAVGFGSDEGMLDYDARSFLGYRLLHEYFTFPEKFLFFDVTNLNVELGAKFGREMEIVITLSEFERPERLARLTQVVNAQTFKLGCTPIVNLFKQLAEPIRISHEKTEYHVVPDVRRQRGMEIYSIDSVRKTVKSSEQSQHVEYQPFYSYKHGIQPETQSTFWYATRRKSIVKDDNGTEMDISLVDLDFNPSIPATETLSIALTCTNRDLPTQLPFGGDQSDMEMEGSSVISRIRCLRKPTVSVRPPLQSAGVWRLISHLSLNHLSIVSEGREALLEILDLYNFARSPSIRAQISGITKVSSQPGIARIGSRQRASFVRGTEIEVEFDENLYEGTGIFVFGRVLEQFFGLYCGLNSYVQLTVRSKQREKELVTWQPRTGDAILI